MMRRRPLALVGSYVALMLGVLLIGCAADEPTMPEGTVRYVDPGQPTPEPGILLPDSDPVRWLSRRLSLPVNQTPEDAWALADERVLDDLSRAVWNGNGLRVGVMPAGRSGAFAEALGDIQDTHDTQVLSYAFPEELRSSPPLRAEFFADLTIPPRPVTLETFTRGRLRMLLASRPLGNGNTRVTLTPQHYLPKTTLLPRSPQERQLDGRVFDELAIDLTLGRNDLLLVGFYQPPPPAEPESETVTDSPEMPPEPPVDPDAPQALPTTIQTPPTPESPESSGENVTIPEGESPEESSADEAELPPLNLGRGLFTTGIEDDDFQLLFMLYPLP